MFLEYINSKKFKNTNHHLRTSLQEPFPHRENFPDSMYFRKTEIVQNKIDMQLEAMSKIYIENVHRETNQNTNILQYLAKKRIKLINKK